MAGYGMISLFWMSLMSSFNPVYSKSCLWNGRPSLHQDEGLVLTDTSDNKQKFGCVNKCVLTNNEVYIIAQEASGNENNNSVRIVINVDRRSHPDCRMSYKLILLSLKPVNWVIDHIGNETHFKLSEVYIYDFAEDGAQSGVTGQGSAQVTHISEFSDEWKNGYFEFLRGFIHQEGLFNDALSINVGEHPTKWTLTVNGTCCRNTTTSVRSTSTWKNSRPPYGETSTSSTGVLSQDGDDDDDDDDNDDDKKRNTALVASLVVVPVILVGVFVALFCYCLHKKNKAHDSTTQPNTEHRHRHRHRNPEYPNHRQPVSDQRYVHNTRSPTPDRVYYEEAATVIPPQIPSRTNRP